jgi:NAD(P)-dependent dehydrogenase (short-subunit alcohol dehydrogenase family)
MMKHADTPMRSVLLTGASTGIGEATALRLAQNGWLVFAGVRKPADGERLQQLAGAAEKRIQPVLLNVTHPEDISAVVQQVRSHLGNQPLTAIVNNAGIALVGPLEYLPIAEWRHQFEVNALGVVAVTQAFLPLLREAARQGHPARVVMVGSVSGVLSFPLLGPYCGSKFALEGIADALRVELLPSGIRTVLIQPGRIRTPIWAKGRSWADTLEQQLPPEAYTHYGTMIANVRTFTHRADREGAPAETCAATIERALTHRRPWARYRVGRDAGMQVLLRRWVPTRWLDALILRFINRPAKS